MSLRHDKPHFSLILFNLSVIKEVTYVISTNSTFNLKIFCVYFTNLKNKSQTFNRRKHRRTIPILNSTRRYLHFLCLYVVFFFNSDVRCNFFNWLYFINVYKYFIIILCYIDWDLRYKFYSWFLVGYIFGYGGLLVGQVLIFLNSLK